MIISKWMIYLIACMETLHGFLRVTSLLAALLWIIMCLALFADGIFIEKMFSKEGKKLWVIVAVIIILNIIIPSKETICLMILSDYLTADNLLVTKDTVISVIKEVSEAIK